MRTRSKTSASSLSLSGPVRRFDPTLQVGLELEEQQSIRIEEERVGIAERVDKVRHVRAELPSQLDCRRVNRQALSAEPLPAGASESAMMREPAHHVQVGPALADKVLELRGLGVGDRKQSLPHRSFKDRLALNEMMAVSTAQGISEMIRNQSSNWVVMVIRASGAKACRKFMAGYT